MNRKHWAEEGNNTEIGIGGNKDKDPWTEAVWEVKRNEGGQRGRN